MSTSSGHDALGRRVFKSNTAARFYAYDEQRKVIGEYDATSTLSETVWLGSTPLAVLRNGQTYWVDADQIDTPRAVLDASNQIVWRWRSEAFGNAQAEEDPSGLGAFEFNHRFPGQMFDKESALHHNDHRDYRAHMGRYTQSDPIGLQGGVNRFGYVEANPVINSDATGLVPGCRLVGFVIVCETSTSPPVEPGVPSPPRSTIPNYTLAPSNASALCMAAPLLCATAIAMQIACRNDDREQECEQKRTQDENLCAGVARPRYGAVGYAVCMKSAVERYSECLRAGVRGIRTPLAGVETML